MKRKRAIRVGRPRDSVAAVKLVNYEISHRHRIFQVHFSGVSKCGD